MFSKKGGKPREKPAGAPRPGADLANMLGFGGQMEPDDDNEDDLLAELAALEGRPTAKKKTAAAPDKSKVTMAEIEQMAAESMKDIDEDEDDDDDDEFDENDLLGELEDLVGDSDGDEEMHVEYEDVDTQEPPARIQPSHQPPAITQASPQPPARMQPSPQPPARMQPSPQPPARMQPSPQPPAVTHPSPPPSAPGPSTDIKTVLNDRKSMYQEAIEMAKSEGNGSKVRRFTRGLKEIEGLIKKAQRGGVINEDDIPPQVASKGSKPPTAAEDASVPPVMQLPPVIHPPQEDILIPGLPAPPVSHKPVIQPASSPPPVNIPHDVPQTSITPDNNTTVDNEKLNLLLGRQKEFKIAALRLKQAGNIDMARKCLGVSKLCDTLINDVKAGKDVDISSIPASPSGSEVSVSNQVEMVPQPQPTPPMPPAPVENEQPAGSSAPAGTSAPAGEAPSGPPPPPKTIMDGLEQRLTKYQEAEKEAKQQGNGGKARRMGRIVKQYQDAIKHYKAGKSVDYNELPCPPGFGPFPGVAPPPDHDAVAAPVHTPAVMQPEPTPMDVAPSGGEPSTAPPPNTTSSVVKPSRNQKEHEFLLNRQKEFKILALQSKRANDVESAREYLKKAKGLDSMIAAAENGLRVDLASVPPLPTEKQASNTPVKESGTPAGMKKNVEFTGNTGQQYAQIENALRKQIETSQKNLEHYKLLGNLDAAKNFQSLFQSSKKDLDTLLAYKKQGSPAPKCQTVLKTFPVIRSNPHLSDAELEIVLIRCVNVPLPAGWAPKDMYTYVTFELHYPQEKPQIGNSTTKKETVNPEFNESFKLIIDRKNRTFGRYCKRNGINLKVFYVRGFLKSDKAIGQATVKFEHFNNRCEIHECVDLVDLEKGRKAVGGKIEVKLKIREPLVDKDAEIIKENWLVLDTHLRGLDMSTSEQIEKPSASSSGYESLEVLKYEKDALEKKINIYTNAKGKEPPHEFSDRVKSYQQKIHFIQTKIKEGGRPAINEYVVALTKELEKQRLLAQEALRRNDKEEAKTCLIKKKLIDKEVAIIKQRLGF